MIAVDCLQGTDEWAAVRRGIPTASEFDKLVTTKGEPSKQAEKYIWRLAGEAVSGRCDPGFTNGWMERGKETEAEAVQFYELINDVVIERPGFCFYDENKQFGCSPDGLIGKDGMIQIKCPSMAVHVGYLLDNKLPTDYFQQVQGELYVCKRRWIDFLSYCPGLKPLIIRVERDEKFIAALSNELNKLFPLLESVKARIKND